MTIKKILPKLMLLFLTNDLRAQERSTIASTGDSVTVTAHASYDRPGRLHRRLFGENYRKDWATPVKVPLIRISDIGGGLQPERQGGGFQSTSLRLRDRSGKEWVLRSVEKKPDKLLPEGLQGTFAVDWIDDEFSGQHPFSALIVPPLAAAADVPHTNPVIGVVADDPALGEFRKTFTGSLCLLEEREPDGPSDNTLKMEKELLKSHRNRFDKKEWLRARLLDLLIADWDRHEDQWRWSYKYDGGIKRYTAVPRDRDQVLHVTQGVFPTIAAMPWLDPMLENFDGKIPRVRYSLYKTKFLKSFPDAQYSLREWQSIVSDFIIAENDDVLESALRRLPAAVYNLRHDELLAKLKKRRDNIPAAMNEYYRFMNKVVDIRLTDKKERIDVSRTTDGGLKVIVTAPDNSVVESEPIMDMVYEPGITHEVRLYLSAGDDLINIHSVPDHVRLRVIGNGGTKTYRSDTTLKNVYIYDRKDCVSIVADQKGIRTHFSNDTLNTRFIPANPYSVWMPLATAAINADDGFLLGAGFKFTHQNGFRKSPYADVQQLMLTHSFATDAFRINYKGEWIGVVGKADLTIEAIINAPDNTTNFFGLGNGTVLNKFNGYRKFYRARFDTYQFDPALRWRIGSGNTLSTGPSLQIYHMDLQDNKGRYLAIPNSTRSYDSTSLGKDRMHLGWSVNFIANHRNNGILPTKGYLINVNVKAYTGLNDASKSFGQLTGEFSIYQKLNTSGTIVLSDRVGGGMSVGNTAFYQSLFLGGQGNLLGYLRNRFAGRSMLYNNLQARVKIANIASYIVPGQLGVTGFYDTGRVWLSGERADHIHQGAGGGVYFAPGGLTILQVLAGHSSEGWYPYISLNFRI